MKILHVTKKYPPALGGDAVVVANLEKQQRADGHQVVVVTSNCAVIGSGKHVYKVGLHDTPEQLDMITLRRLCSLLILAVRAFVIFRRERPDVIHTHSVDMACAVSAAAHWYHIPTIHTFHIVTFYDTQQSRLRRLSELWLAKMAAPRHITTPNAFDTTQLQAAGFSRTTTLPNGVDLGFWRADAAPTTTDAPFRFLAVGRLENQKDYPRLIRAAASLKQEGANFHLEIVGEGSQRASLQTLVDRLKLTSNVTIAGHKTAAQTRALLNKADAAICTSRYETTPLTLLEAWATGTPVISTRVGILRQVADSFPAAYVISDNCTDTDLARTMWRCMADMAERQTVVKAGLAEVQQYAWPVIARSVEALYGEVT